tara:strand:- start:2984 stop:4522 length:1539 start_codon:yes stop_codon:yes gene_type:complete
MACVSGPKILGLNNLVAYFDAGNLKNTGGEGGQNTYTTAGTYSFVVPVGITSISAVCVGGGGGGGGTDSSIRCGGGGGGGGLSYGTFLVTPGETLTIVVGSVGAGGADTGTDGSAGGDSQVKRSSTVLLQGGGGSGGDRGINNSTGGAGGTSTGTERDGGGTGGGGGGGDGNPGGGGGAGGYSGNGGNNTYDGGASSSGADGSGGGGGGGSTTNASSATIEGGGVGILGEGSSGTGGLGGSGNLAGNDGNPGSGGSGQLYGGGGGGGTRVGEPNAGAAGGIGAVRLVYQLPTIGNRKYPDGSGTLSNLADNVWKNVISKKLIANMVNGTLFDAENFGSMKFDGTDDYATFNPDTLGISALSTQSFTFEIWANFVGEGPFYFIDTRNSSQSTNRWALLVNANEKLEWYTGYESFVFDTPVWDTGNNGWNYIVFSREGTGSNQFKLYVNGAYVSAKTDSTNYNSSSTEASIGRRYGNTEFLDGKISLIRMYKGKAFTAEEVSNHYEIFKYRFGI